MTGLRGASGLHTSLPCGLCCHLPYICLTEPLVFYSFHDAATGRLMLVPHGCLARASTYQTWARSYLANIICTLYTCTHIYEVYFNPYLHI